MTQKEYFEMGVKHYERGEYGKAIQNFEEAIKGVDEEIKQQAYFYCGVVYGQQGGYEQAIKYFTEAVKGTNEAIKQQAYLNCGMVYEEQGEYEQAIKYFTEAVKGVDEEIKQQAYFNCGTACGKQGKYEQAIKYFTEAVKGTNEAIKQQAYFYCGMVYEEQGEYEQAIKNFMEAIEGKDEEVKQQAYFYCGMVYEEQGEYEQAIKNFMEAIKGKDEKIKQQAYFNCGMAYGQQGQYNQAIKNFMEAIEGKDEEVKQQAYLNCGVAYVRLEQYEAAIKNFMEAIEGKDEEVKQRAYLNCGVAYGQQGQYNQAIKNFMEAIKGVDEEVKQQAYLNCGVAYGQQEQYNQAIKNFMEATKGLDEEVKQQAYFNCGITYVKKVEYHEGVKSFEKAIKINIDEEIIALAHKQIIVIYFNCEKYKEICKYYENNNIIKVLFEKISRYKNASEEKDSAIDNNISLNLISAIESSEDDFEIINMIMQDSKIRYDDTKISLLRIFSEIQKILNECKIVSEELCHYTKSESLKYMLPPKEVPPKEEKTSKFRLFNAVYMNDPEEGIVLQKLLKKKFAQEQDDFFSIFELEEKDYYTYLASFCNESESDILPMWVHYGNGATGINLKFHKDFFKGESLYKVIYIDSKENIFDSQGTCNDLEKKVYQSLENIVNILQSANQQYEDEEPQEKEVFWEYAKIFLNYVSYLFKDKAYEYEQEVRLLKLKLYNDSDVNVTDEDIPRLYVEGKEIKPEYCTGIITGPKADYEKIAAYAKYVGIKSIKKSRIKYR